ncbi:SDR family NAD(P)-dependent oxidoreductase [Hoyosella sp. G463]|uniref:SDR family NAD(P)-dependent oxidoreductase n=1 Tax=Lolliginicoccus lacisalsi TaxID=2742202 RepID=A0A927JC67_9ACTN|nr:SDR family NAD(P)-dependent oxidoreductase [Lolliginicoccus lacisalsi]MBD8506519.1 SDR family NAD(P)-dependent oxidoreductase [Lolliginicoccus lacisalsi]
MATLAPATFLAFTQPADLLVQSLVAPARGALSPVARAPRQAATAMGSSLRSRRPSTTGPLHDRRIVITGASSGIGAAAAHQIAANGGTVLLVARSLDKLLEVKDSIEAEGGTAFAYPCDITDSDAVERLIEQIVHEHGTIDMLVNNAGRSIRRSIALSHDRFHDFERTMSLNYFAAIRLILGLLPHMKANAFGHIVNISSIGVQTSAPRFSAYVASKAALDAFSDVVATETLGSGVTFTTIHMPLVRTPMIAPTTMYDAFPTLSPEEAANLVVRALVKRPVEIGTPVGTFGELMHALAPKITDRILHQAYKAFPDSLAAQGERNPGEKAPENNTKSTGPGLSRRTLLLARASRLARTQPLSGTATAMMRLLPGIHW